MNRTEIEETIDNRLADREASVRNRNAIKALFGAFSDPVGALGEIFLGGTEAVDAERQRLQQDAVLDLLCKIDDAITQIAQGAETRGFEISGLIETTADGGESAVGVDIAANAGPVRMQPGTHIRTSSSDVRKTTGLKISGNKDD